ncbi:MULTISPECIES: type II toxin-antitoxin system RelE/ParE family toxin [Dethiosulfovibrio]|uniref:Type II toxin-antitoxin system RelE/ParE family toxin n=2 Tax=Dethiosulfovibrio TaxID=47054 RepID=A0ABS9ERH3_9BACT|nr:MULTISPECIES: type II toxin-antitoxin system RelE/ParE family toxin [Dethiosulfovibrio]MCF4143111.1 type II toxin-antitoxin system RelE/ParE family toxin [Dethiosulfovibrio marinus]MCF4145189.1 type II toxin-antitoxin system RelE/ParE family toxin [Dethiosulfovibrio acidaminovorans]
MNRIFITKAFYRWMSKNRINNDSIIAAVKEMESGLIDADLGGYICKKRIPLPGQGKRGSARTIVATKQENSWFFIYGFNKNERSNISSKELESFQEMAKGLLSLTNQKLSLATRNGALKEVSSK